MTHLGEGLGQSDLVTLLDKVAQCVGVAVRVARGKALVGHVEKGKVLLLLDDVADLLPVVVRWVHARRVVRTRVQQDDALGWGGLVA